MTEKNKEKEIDELAEEVEKDFERRREERRALELKWRLYMNFVNGNQYCKIEPSGLLVDEEPRYFWQQRRVFNHIAPILDTRLAKLSRMRPAMAVRAASDEESDRNAAALASNILAAVQENADMDGVVSAATVWAETCGTAFYKIVWASDDGATVGVTADGKALKEGNAKVVCVPPFEIYPYCLSEESIEAQPSIIHAKAVSVEDIYEKYGVKLEGRDIEEFSFKPKREEIPRQSTRTDGFIRHGYEIVIERYEKPTAERPQGRLITVAGGKVLYDGELPYENGQNLRTYPFVRQISVRTAGCFFGSSIVDRLIPLQRAFNAVKNRKHEFLNRIVMGAYAVEDGSVDMDELAEDGVAPGKVIVYRQGGTPPQQLSIGGVPDEFWKEETSLLTEFSKIAGGGDLSENADNYSGITSATGLQLIIEQNDARLNVSYDSIKRAMRLIGRHILRLYRQFGKDIRLIKYADKNAVMQLAYFKGSDISSDDVILCADSDLNLTMAQKRTVLFEMMDRGLFNGSDGKIDVTAKNKLLELLGYEHLASGRDLRELNRARAEEENEKLVKGTVEVKEYDDHAVHIEEHKAFLLSGSLKPEAEKRVIAHLLRHEKAAASQNKEENDGR